MARHRTKITTERAERLTRAEIVDGALRLVSSVGLENITMRGLADELGVTPMATYHYVPNKEALLQLVVDAVLDQVKPEIPSGAGWKEHLRAEAAATWETMSRYPGVAAFLLDRPLAPGAWASMHRQTQLMMDAGFDEHEAFLAYATYHTYLVGRLALEARIRGKRRLVTTDDSTSSARAANRIPAREFVTYGIETVLEGIEVRLQMALAAKVS